MTDKISPAINKEMEKLVQELNYHNYRYYVLDEPVISACRKDASRRKSLSI